jgi:linoleate 10R-lipoxygenase
MSSFVDSVRDASDFVHASRAAYDNDGAAPSHGILSSAIGKVETFLSAGSSISVKDMPAYMDAIKNLNGVGIDDREFLVRVPVSSLVKLSLSTSIQLEKLVLLMSKLPSDDGLGQKLEQFFIQTRKQWFNRSCPVFADSNLQSTKTCPIRRHPSSAR